MADETHSTTDMPTISPAKRAGSSRKRISAVAADKPVRKKPTSKSKSDSEVSISEALGIPGTLSAKPRQTLPVNANVLGQLPWQFLPRRQYQDMDLTTLTPGSFSPQQLLELLADAHPDLSQALWNNLRLATASYKYDVRTPDNTAEDPAGKAILDEIVGRINKNWGGFDSLLTQWVMSVILEGACAGETIPNETIDDVADVITVQPWTIYFQRDIEQNYIAYQWQPMMASAGTYPGAYSVNPGTSVYSPDPTAKIPSAAELTLLKALDHGGFRMLNEITFGYVPLDPHVDDPYGRMPYASVMQIIVFDAQMLKDLREWSHVNAWGRIDVSVVAEKVAAMMPPNIANNAKERYTFFTQYLTNLQAAYNNLSPDDTYIHYDNVIVSNNASAGETMNVDNLIRIIERRMFRALKQLPILMGSNEGTTETWGTLQMEVYALGIASIQRVVANLVERLLTVALRLRGRASVVTFTFDQLRATDRLKSAQAEGAEIKNAAAKRDQGWIEQDEAAVEVTGSKAVADAPDPDNMTAPNMPDSAAYGGQQPPQAAPDGDNPAGSPKDGDASKDDLKNAGDTQTKLDNDGKSRAMQIRAAPAERDPYTSTMIGHFLAPDIATQLRIDGGENAADLHFTLAFFGESLDADQTALLHQIVERFSNENDPLYGKISGIGRFTSVDDGEQTPIYASVDMPGLSGARASLMDAIDDAGITRASDHDFTPHITLAHIDKEAPMPDIKVPALDFRMSHITVAEGEKRTQYPIGQRRPLKSNSLSTALVTHHVTALQQRAKEQPYRPPSKARRAMASALAEKMRGYFASHVLSKSRVERIVADHDVRSLVMRAQVTKQDQPLSQEQLAALQKSIERALQNDYPDDDDDLSSMLQADRLDSYNIGGQEALERVGLSGDFTLRNSAILATLAAAALSTAQGILKTTRQQVASQIVDSLEKGADPDEASAHIIEWQQGKFDSRADTIGNTETASAFHTAALDVWQHNGVGFKVWKTGGDPDPHAGATGATPCRDNAYAGAIRIDDTFPSGDSAPPAHPECECDLQPSGDPSDAATTSPWLGE